MQYCSDHPEDLSKIARVKSALSEVRGIVIENIEKVGIPNPMLMSDVH